MSRLSIAILAVLVSAPALAGPPAYTLEGPILPPSYTVTLACKSSRAGHLTGGTASAVGSVPYVYTPGAGVQVYEGPVGPIADYDVNTYGTACGITESPGPDFDLLPFVWSPGDAEVTYLPLPAGESGALPRCINDSGQVAGGLFSSTNTNMLLWDSPTSEPLVLAVAVPVALNNAGQLLLDGAIWQDGTYMGIPLCGEDINDVGVVAGWAYDGGANIFPVKWKDGQVFLLPVPEGLDWAKPIRINNSELMGGYGVAPDGTEHAVIWTADGAWKVEDLVDLPEGTTFTLVEGSLADSGLITISAGLDDGSFGYFHLVPAQPCGDLTGDGLVDGADLGVLLGRWGEAGLGDLSLSGAVDGADLGLLLASWGNCE